MASDLQPPALTQSGNSSTTSLHITYTDSDLERLAKELYDATIADVLLSQLISFINDSPTNYRRACLYIEELKICQTYNTSRDLRPAIQHLLNSTLSMRPRYILPTPALLPRRRQQQPSSSTYTTTTSISIHDMLAAGPPPSPPAPVLRQASHRFSTLLHRTNTSPPRPSPSRLLSRLPAPLRSFSHRLSARSGTPAVPPSSLRSISAPLQPAMQGARIVSGNSAGRASPPCTPDRPAPLRVRSREVSGRTEGEGDPFATPESVEGEIRGLLGEMEGEGSPEEGGGQARYVFGPGVRVGRAPHRCERCGEMCFGG
ncbi:hypothetical protein EJ04DRAFT_578207 [Polyplosphaeria fusca]|uniref:Uncharacterized protein n=1 Tax=Polyplosphaeria fusca TaxID=682080 RepID=A0A9P4UZP6_9PLEO|nr:hypothetical protein EJ04DRAFT_578207 [Polyplosphaeria fusca]